MKTNSGKMEHKKVEPALIKIETITSARMKTDICNTILSGLPNWFGNKEAIIDYTNQVRQMPFYAALDENNAVGFAAVKVHNEYTAEICVMGVLEDYHRQGIGGLLVRSCEEYCSSNQIKFLTVKTLDVSADYEPYDKTRAFYRKMGFFPLEVFPLHWDKDNPCLFLAKYIAEV